MTEPRQPKREMKYRRRGADEGPVAPPETPFVQERNHEINPIFTSQGGPRRNAFWLQVAIALIVIALIGAVVFGVLNLGGAPQTHAPDVGEAMLSLVAPYVREVAATSNWSAAAGSAGFAAMWGIA